MKWLLNLKSGDRGSFEKFLDKFVTDCNEEVPKALEGAKKHWAIGYFAKRSPIPFEGIVFAQISEDGNNYLLFPSFSRIVDRYINKYILKKLPNFFKSHGFIVDVVKVEEKKC